MKRLVLKLVKWLVLWWTGKTPLNEMGELVRVLAQSVYEYRKTHKGYVPLEIFASCIGIGGVYPCVEAVVEVADAGGYALKKRGGGEQGWEGQYQIAGTAGRTTDSPKDIYKRLEQEIFGQSNGILLRKGEVLGIEIHAEPERLAVCWTLVFKLKVAAADLAGFSGEWKVFQDLNGQEIIDHHRNTLRWASNPNRKVFDDLRD